MSKRNEKNRKKVLYNFRINSKMFLLFIIKNRCYYMSYIGRDSPKMHAGTISNHYILKKEI